MADTLVFDALTRDRASRGFLNIGEAAHKAGESIEGMGRKAKRAGELLSGHLGVVSRIGGRTFGVFATGAKAAGLALGGLAAAGVTMGLKTAASLEQAQIAFGTLLRSGAKAQKFLGNLAKFAASTPFELPGLIDSSRILLGVGVAADKVIPLLQDLGDTAGAVGIQQDGFNRIVLALSQSIAAGTIKLGDMNQLMNNGLPIWGLLSKAMHKPVPVLQEMISKGQLMTADVLPKLQAQMHKDYGGAMAKQSQTLSGLWSTFMDTLNIGLAQTLQPLIPTLKVGLTGAIKVLGRAMGGMPKVTDNMVSGVKTAFAFLVPFVAETLVPQVQAAADEVAHVIGLVADDVKTAWASVAPFLNAVVFPAVKARVAGFVADITARSVKLGTGIWTGLQQGVESGNWSKLGEAVGTLLADTLHRALQTALDIARWVGEIAAKVDWVGLGISLGKQVPSLLIGLAAGILNFDLGSLLKGLAAHWQDILLGVLAIAFTPGRIIAKVAGFLRKIPFVGALLAWALEHLSAFSKGLVRMVGDALGFLGRAFLEGFAKVFPGVGRSFGLWLRLLPTRIGLAALWVREAIGRLIAGLGNAIANGAGFVARKIGELIATIIRPWVNAGSWLIQAGLRIVSGLWSGLVTRWRVVTTWLAGLKGSVVAHFRAAGEWLLNVGFQIISGMWQGFQNAMRKVGEILGNIKDAIVGGLKRLFGISSPSRVMAGIGANIITGLIRGLLTNSGALARIVKGIGGTIGGIFPTLIGARSPATPTAMQAMVKGYAQMLYGWQGAQWTALYNLLMGESGFNPNAQNPTSSAYGIFQFLDSTWAGVNAVKTSNPNMQTLAGLRYIKQRYGSPTAAYGAWLSRSPHWYDRGGLLMPGTTLAVNDTGAPERVLGPGEPVELGPRTLRALGEVLGQTMARGVLVAGQQARKGARA